MHPKTWCRGPVVGSRKLPRSWTPLWFPLDFRARRGPFFEENIYVVAFFAGVCDPGLGVWKWRRYGAQGPLGSSEILVHEVSRRSAGGAFQLHRLSPLIIFLVAPEI